MEINVDAIEPNGNKIMLVNCLLQFFLKIQNGTSNILRKNKQKIKQIVYITLHVLFVAYFAWATHYFVKYSNSDLASTTCSGYGFLMILFIFIYLGIAYYLVIKPFLKLRFTQYEDTQISKTLNHFFSNRIFKIISYLAMAVTITVYLIIDTSGSRERLIPLTGLALFLILGFLFSKHPGQINWKPIIWGLILQFVFGLLTIRWNVGRNIFECLGNKITTFLGYGASGAAFTYGEFLVYEQHVFAFKALSAVYFLAFIINVLYYYGVMQRLIVVLGEFLQAMMGTSLCESVNSAANIFLGMTESPLLLKPYLKNLTASEIHSIMASGFATVSGGALAGYISFGAEASHLITASVMSAPAALCYSKLVFPEIEEIKVTKESIQLMKSEYSSVLDAASQGATIACEMVLGIVANIIGFISLITFINGVLSWVGLLLGYDGAQVWTIETLFGYLFMPLSFTMGVPWEESQSVGKLIGIKTIINEFVAYKEMGNMSLTKRTKVIATYAICGFSNPGSIGIMISAMSAIIPEKRELVTSVAVRAFITGEIVCFMTACIAALLTPDDLL